jgi:hypothetical protein
MRSVTHVRNWIFDVGIWSTVGGAADKRVAPSRCELGRDYAAQADPNHST